MKNQFISKLILVALVLLQACAAPKFFHDPSSLERQKELRNSRSANVFVDIGAAIGNTVLGAAFETEIGFDISEQQFKKLNLLNTTGDTMYVNMLTDVYWDENNYCDFMDIRIPPKLNCKVMVPIDANYNIYFSTTPESEDDEMLEVNTSSIKRIKLIPRVTPVENANENDN